MKRFFCLLSLVACVLTSCLVTASPASAQFRPANQVVQQVPLTVFNRLSIAVNITWSRDGVSPQSLGALGSGQSQTINVTLGDTIQLWDSTSGQLVKAIRPYRPETVVLQGLSPNPAPVPVPPVPVPPVPVPPVPVPPVPVPPQPNPQPVAPSNLAQEGMAAINYLNQVRQNPLAFSQDLGIDTSGFPVTQALRVNSKLMQAAQRKADYMAQNGSPANPFSSMMHVLTINGQQVGMNQWMREAGYKVPRLCSNNETNFECLAGQSYTQGCSVQMIKMLLQDPPHQRPMTGVGFWAPCKDVGIGIAVSPDGQTVFLSILMCWEEN